MKKASLIFSLLTILSKANSATEENNKNPQNFHILNDCIRDTN